MPWHEGPLSSWHLLCAPTHRSTTRARAPSLGHLSASPSPVGCHLVAQRCFRSRRWWWVLHLLPILLLALSCLFEICVPHWHLLTRLRKSDFTLLEMHQRKPKERHEFLCWDNLVDVIRPWKGWGGDSYKFVLQGDFQYLWELPKTICGLISVNAFLWEESQHL